MRTTVVVASFLHELLEPAVFRPAQVLDQPAHGCRRRDERAAGIGIGKTGNLTHHDVSIVVEESLQCGALADYLLLATIGTLRFCHDGEASTARSFAGSAPFPDAPGYLGGQLRVRQQQLDERADDLLSGDAGESEPVGGFALPDIEGPVCGGGQVDGASRSLAA